MNRRSRIRTTIMMMTELVTRTTPATETATATATAEVTGIPDQEEASQNG